MILCDKTRLISKIYIISVDEMKTNIIKKWSRKNVFFLRMILAREISK